MPSAPREFHLAQVNIGVLVAPLTAPEIADFVALLDPVNALADASPGFVWRLQSESGNATDIRPFDDDRILINMSVWRSLEELRDFVYRTRHVDVLRRRREWFEKLAEAHLALWWLPAGRIPTTADAEARIRLLREKGPTPDAFTFRTPFGPPGASRPEGSGDRRRILPAARGDARRGMTAAARPEARPRRPGRPELSPR